MDNFKAGITIEPTDNYEKALKDMFQMKESFRKLNKAERDKLVREAFALEISNLSQEQVGFLMALMNMIQAR